MEELKVELYQHVKHYDLLSMWALKRKRRVTPKNLFPQIGFVVGSVACGFLYQTETTFALIENLSTDPDAPKELKDPALDRVVECILKAAWELGFQTVMGTTHLPAITERALRHGFTISPTPTTLVIRHKREGEERE